MGSKETQMVNSLKKETENWKNKMLKILIPTTGLPLKTK